MVLCSVYGCKKDSNCHHNVSYYRLPGLTRRYGLVEYELRKQRRVGYLAALQRKNVSEEAIKNFRVCSRHFINNRPAGLYDVTNPDWLPMLHLGHCEESCNDDRAVCKAVENVARYERAKHREEQKQKAQSLAKELQELLQLAPSVVE